MNLCLNVMTSLVEASPDKKTDLKLQMGTNQFDGFDSKYTDLFQTVLPDGLIGRRVEFIGSTVRQIIKFLVAP